jgi:hypothetical protein
VLARPKSWGQELARMRRRDRVSAALLFSLRNRALAVLGTCVHTLVWVRRSRLRNIKRDPMETGYHRRAADMPIVPLLL